MALYTKVNYIGLTALVELVNKHRTNHRVDEPKQSLGDIILVFIFRCFSERFFTRKHR
jgi:hypothetical protein